MLVLSLGWEDSQEEGIATHSSILAWRIPWTEELVDYSPLDCKQSDKTEATYHACTCLKDHHPPVCELRP